MPQQTRPTGSPPGEDAPREGDTNGNLPSDRRLQLRPARGLVGPVNPDPVLKHSYRRRYARGPDSMPQVALKMAAGTWVSVCRLNAEKLQATYGSFVEVQVKPWKTRKWEPLTATYEYRPHDVFRAKKFPLE